MSQSSTPRRIVSLVPSLTETLCDFGLQAEIVGCTSFCVHPASLRHSAVAVGGTKDPSLEKIRALSPTHVLVNQEENTAAFLATLHAQAAKEGWQVVDTFPVDVRESIAMVQQLGQVFGFSAAATAWATEATAALEQCEAWARAHPAKRYAYFIWREPWMVAGNHTYIAAMLHSVGLVNVIETGQALAERYPAIEVTDPRLAKADLLLFSSEPFPFKNRHLEEFTQSSGLASTPALKIDGQFASWYGSRTLPALRYLNEFVRAL